MSTSTPIAYHPARRHWRPLELWHLTSLDAPSVALVWTLLFSWKAHAPLFSSWVLAVAAWALYLTDRLLDARRANRHPETRLEERHRFHQRHRNTVLGLLAVAAVLLTAGIALLPATVRNGWLLLALPLVCYFALVHGTRMPLPKELAVALFFAAACALPGMVQERLLQTLPHTLLFAMLCGANCIAIARWEGASERHGESPLVRWCIAHFDALCLFLLCCSPVLAIGTHEPRLAICIALSAALLLGLDRHRCRLSPTLLRSLADAALMTPLLLLPALLLH